MIHTIFDDNDCKWFYDDEKKTLIVEGSEDISAYDIESFYTAIIWLRENDYIIIDKHLFNDTRQFLISKGIIKP